jgi:minor extracellular protease Epr
MSNPRPRRFIIIPKLGVADEAPTPSQTMRLMRLSSGPVAAAAKRARIGSAGVRPVKHVQPPTMGLKVVNSSPADGAVLVEAKHVTIAQIKARAPAGAKVVEEQWYRLERPTRPWLKLSATLKKPRTLAGRTMKWTATVVLGGAARTRLAQALVTVMVDEAKGIGIELFTDRFGRATFELSSKTTRLDAIYIDPLHGGWPIALSNVDIATPGMQIAVPEIDLSSADVRGLVYGKPAAGAGKGVKVGVVDTGVGPHAALKVAGGRNTTTNESVRRYRDEDGHGSHVAGVIAAAASGWRRGEASAVGLHSYKIFEARDPYASTFAIQAAIKQAAIDGCDLINLSIGDSMADESVRDAVEFAWSLGSVCVAATGNDGKGQVDYPARYAKAIAVSAIGLEGSWPAGANFGWTLSASRGNDIAGHQSFLASFSNRGVKVALTAPGVAVVSTIFDNRWGAMSGTSMATPIATGVLARRLAASPVCDMPRDAARAAAIVQLARDHAEDLGLAANMQGDGLAR